jgi:hypothetical protein
MTPGFASALRGRKLTGGKLPVGQGVKPGFQETLTIVLVI